MAKSRFINDLVTKELLGSKYAELYEPFIYFSGKMNRHIIVPAGFICDYESVPLIKGSSKRAGVLHDYLCRTDSDPVVTKQLAADIYGEAQKCRDKLIGGGFRMAIKRKVKTAVVRIVWGYFHKFPVLATLEEICR